MANLIKLRRSAVTGAVPTTAQLDLGELAINTHDGKLFLKRDNGIGQYIVEVGGSLGFEVKNQTGSTIPKGAVLKFAGTLGASGKLLAAPFLANNTDPSEYVIGLAENDILSGDDGFAIDHGKIFQLNTSAFSEGAILYASASVSGGLTATRPAAPNNKVIVAAVVRSHATTGILEIKVVPGSALDNDELVELGTLASNDALIYNSTAGRFENRASTGIDNVVLSNSPVLVTPTLGAASATSIANGLGAVGTPSYTFTGDLNTGMWSPTADTIAFSEGGTEAMRITSAGNVGIGTTAPDRKLDVQGSGSITVRSRSTDTSGITVGILAAEHASGSSLQVRAGVGFTNLISTGATDPLIFSANSAEAMRIISAGNVGIGTSSPAQRLHVATTAAASGTTQSFLRATADVGFGADFGGGIIQGVGPIATISTVSSGTATERMRITSGGNVGIGTTSPAQKLHVNGNALLGGSPAAQYSTVTISGDAAIQSAAPLLNFVNAAGSTRFGYLYHTGSGGNIELLNQQAGAMLFGTNNTERMRIDTSGNVGIGTNSPDANAKLDVAGTVRSGAGGSDPGTGAVFYLVGSGSFQTVIGGAAFAVNTGANNARTERMRIDSSGNVGIGLINPGYPLAVQANSGSGAIRLVGRPADSISTLEFANSAQSSTQGYIQSNGNNLLFATSTSERMRIDSSGNVGIGTIAPLQLLQVHGSSGSDVYMRVSNTDSGTGSGLLMGLDGNEAGVIRLETNQPLSFGTNNTERMRIDSSGNVGIGVTPLTRLDVSTSGGSRIRTDTGNSLLVTQFVTNAAANAYVTSRTDAFDYQIYTGGSEKVRIDSSGNLGIGTTSPASRIHVAGTGSGPTLRLENQTASTGKTYDIISGDGGPLRFQDITAGAERMRIASDGNVGIGTTSPASLLHVKRGSNAIEVYPAGTWATRVINATDGSGENGLLVGNRWAGTGSNVFEAGSIYGGGTGSWHSYYRIDGTGQSFWSNGGTERMRLDTSGNVGIGTTGPTAKLHVQGTGYFNDDLTVNGGQIFTAATQARVKFGVWSDTTYGIGMQSGYTYGGLVNDYAMTFQFSNTNTRGFWWGDSSHTNAQGAMALTTNGKLTIAHSVRVGFGETDNTVPGSVYILDVSGAANIIGNTNIGGSGGTYQGLSIRNSDDSAVGETVNFIDARNNLGTATGSFFFHNQTDGGSYITLGNTPAGDRATDRRTERMRILANGNVGIGTTAAAQRLHVRQDQDGTTAAIIQNRNGTGSPASALQFISGAFDLSDNRYAMISSAGGGSNTLQFWTAAGASPTQKMVITSAGNVGIGVASPPQLLALGNTTDQVGAGVSGAVSTLYFGSPSTGSGGIKRLAYDRATGALTFIGGSVASSSTQMTIASGGEITAAVDFRAPIFYDSNDTGKYLNPNGSSFLIGTTVITRDSNSNDTFGGLELRENNVQGAATGAANEAPGVNFHWSMRGAARIYMNGSGHFVFAGQTDITNNRRDIYFASSYAATDSRAPIFYDSNNTAFFFDGASTTNINTLNGNGKQIFNTGDTYLRINEGSAFSSGCWFGGSLLQGGGFYTGSNGGTTNSRVAIIGGTYNGTNVITLDGSNGRITASDIRAPIFYDSNNTAYYINPNGDSNLYKTFTYLGGRDVNANWNTGFQNTLPQSYNFHGDVSSGGPTGTWWFYESMRHSNGTNYWGTQIAWGWEDNANRMFQRNVTSGSFGGWVEYLNTSNRTYTGNLNMTGSIISTSSDVRAPIFYDQNDTTYYVDPNSGTSAVFVGDVVMGPELNMVVGARTDRYIDVKGDLYFRYSDNSTFYNSRMLIRQSGAILSYADFESSGNITAYASDRRLKTNIVPIKNALQKLLSIGGYTFDWDMDKCEQHGFTPTQVHEHGVIAQEIEEIMPDVVVHAPFDKETRPNHDMSASRSGEWFKTVNYDKIVPLLIEAIKEQQAHINKMQQEIEILKGDK